MKKWVVGLAILSLTLGSAGSVWAFDLDDLDPTNWKEECDLGKKLGAVMDGMTGVPIATFIGWGADILGADCDVSDIRLLEFNLDEINKRVSTGATLVNGTVTNGSMTVDIRRRYWFDTNGNDVVDTAMPWGKNWRWRNKSKGEYFKARYAVTSANNNGVYSMQVLGSALPNTNSQTPASYTTPYSDMRPYGYVYLYDTRFGGTTQTPYAVWVPGQGNIWHVVKIVNANSIVKNNPYGTSTLKLQFPAGKVRAKSVPNYGKRFQHVVYRRP